MGVEAPWEEEPLFTQMLMHDPAKKEDFHKIDLFHTISLGIGKPFAASAVSILQELMAGGSIEQRLKEFTSMYLEYCRDFGLQFWVIVQRCSKFFLVCSLAWLWPPGFPITCMHNKPSGVPSQGKSENELCPKDRQGFAWMDWLCRACWELVQGCIHNILVPIFGTPLWDLWFGEWWGRRVSIDSTCGCDNFEKYNLPWKIWKVLCSPHFFLMYPSTCKASSVRAVNYFMSSLYKSNALICRDSVASVIAAGRHFLRGYARLAFLAHRQKVARFALVPKCHMFFHVVHRMHQETQISEFILNPIVFSTACDEDFIGRYCALTRAVSPRQRILRSMQRYLSAVFLFWVRGPNARWWVWGAGWWWPQGVRGKWSSWWYKDRWEAKYHQTSKTQKTWKNRSDGKKGVLS